MDLRACLDQCSLGLLRQIAAAHAVVLAEPPARAEVARLVAERLGQPEYLAVVAERLSDGERLALELVAAEGGELRGYVLERRLRQSEPAPTQETVHRLLSELVGRGLLYRTFHAIGPERGEVYLVPAEVAALLPPGPAVESVDLRLVDEPTEVLRAAPLFTLFAMSSFIRRWRQVGEARGQGGDGQLGALARETADLTVELPSRAPRERWTLLAHLGLRLGLFAREEGGLQPTERLEEWLALGEVAEQQLWATYVGAEQWNDLERARTGGGRFAGRTVEPVAARTHLLGLIRELPAERWLLIEDLKRLVRVRAPDFLREGFEVGTARLMDLESGELLAGPASWERVEGQLFDYLFSGPLYWLGVVEWGRSEQGWDRVRLTPTGQTWLAGSEEVLVPTPAPCEVLDGRRLLAPSNCELALLWQAEPYLHLEQRGPPSRYQLTRISLARGLEAGGSVGDLRRLIERLTGGPLPLELSLALSRWADRVGRFRLRPLVVLLAESAEELDAVLERPDAAPLVRERLGPRAVAVAPARAAELAQLLERHGHLPELDAALRLMAGRRAYAAQVDQSTLEALLFCIRLVKALQPELVSEIPHAERLLGRLEQALGPIAGPRISRRARAIGRRLRRGLPAADGVARSSGEVV